MTDQILVFDRAAVRAHRERSVRLAPDARFLRRAVQARLVDRLNEVRRSFKRALDLGCGEGGLHRLLGEAGQSPRIVALDPAPGFAAGRPLAVVADEEALPFAEGSFDLVVSTLGLQWTNDLPGALLQIRRILEPDGLLLAAFYGGRTLAELRETLTLAELEVSGGASPRISPFADIRDAGMLLQRAGFALPVADAETLTVTYDNALSLMRDLRAMGETNALIARSRAFLRRDVLYRAAEVYRDRFAAPDGRIPASFEVVTLTAWSPAESQPKPLRPGSAELRLAEALGTVELSAGDKAGPPR